MKVAIAQIAPVWLDRPATEAKIVEYIHLGADAGAGVIAFGETLLPGYPFWLDGTGGARFNDPVQKEIFAHYHQQAVCPERGDLNAITAACASREIGLVLGILERPLQRGGHSLYCSLVYVDPTGRIRNVHRKLQPTYEERLVWSPGDGHGLRTFPQDDFVLGGLNCWENWMPLPRAALYAQGETLHFALWPGNTRNTDVLTRFLAREGRSYVVSASSLFRPADVPDSVPHADLIRQSLSTMPADGGSCIAKPDGSWLVAPSTGTETLLLADLDPDFVVRERQNFDPSGHYSRPDVTRLVVNRERQSVVRFEP